MTATLIGEDAAQLKRLIEFAAEVNQLANQRLDLDLRVLVDDLHHDLLILTPKEEDQ